MENNRLFDLRTLERNFQKGLISEKEYEAFLKKLPDTESNAITIAAQFDSEAATDDSEE